VSSPIPNQLPESSLTPIEGPVAHLLARLQAGWSPLPFDLPSVLSMHADEEDFTQQLVSVRIVNEALEVRLRGRRLMKVWSTLRTVKAQTSDGGQLRGRISGNDTHLQVGDADASSELLLRCLEWSYEPSTAPLIWGGLLKDVPKLPGPGNLAIRRQTIDKINSSSGHLRLERPGLVSYFIATNSRTNAGEVWLCFDGQASESTLHLLRLDFQLFRMALSIPIRPGLFYGLNADGRTVAARTTTDEQAAREIRTGLNALVPVSYNQMVANRLQIWVAPFYSRLFEQYMQNETANPISYSLSRYSHTLTQFDVDTQYELVAGAVAILIKELIRRTKVSAEIQTAKQADQQFLERLSVPSVAEGKSEASTVVGYAELLGLHAERALLVDLDPQAGPLVADELVEARKLFERGAMQGYNASAHQGLLGYYNRVQQLRRAYAVLLARAINYHGPVSRFLSSSLEEQLGWMRGDEASVEIKQEAEHFYLIDEDLSGLTVWPRFALQAPPENALINRFVSFADGFRQSTQGKIIARLRPLPKKAEEPYRFSFRLMVNKSPASQVALFTIEVVLTGLVVRGWTDKPIPLTSEAELVEFEHQLSHSAQFDEQVQRLLLIEEDIQRGEA
jgi:hypothetical protein